MAEFFARNIILVYFFYGLSFFSMGLAVWFELGHNTSLDFAQALRPLAGFGLVHGGHEWFEMFLLIDPALAQGSALGWVSALRLILLASSFIMLIVFGMRLIAGPMYSSIRWGVLLAVAAVWLAGLIWVLNTQPAGPARLVASDVYTRYALAIPGAALTVWGLILQRRNFNQMGMERFGHDVTIAAVAFGLYGGIGQVFATPSALFPSGYLNADQFSAWFGFPVQVFRAAMAMIAAIAIVRSLRAFEVANTRRMTALREAQRAERRHLDATRAELLHRTVKAQESERQRIARELHDETGQTLTALALGLRALESGIETNPQRAIQQARRLESVAADGIAGLQRLVSGLHPPQLDDLGLLAALRWYAGEVEKTYNLPVNLASQGAPFDLTPEQRVALFRIAQEALTNTLRHARASRVDIQIQYDAPCLTMTIEDDGQGFDVAGVLRAADRPSWGLFGIQERADLIGARCRIDSTPGQGTRVSVAFEAASRQAEEAPRG